MTNYRPADHAMGLELQLEELIEKRARAEVQGRTEDLGRLDKEIAALQAELVATAERVATEGAGPETEPELHNAEELSVTDPE